MTFATLPPSMVHGSLTTGDATMFDQVRACLLALGVAALTGVAGAQPPCELPPPLVRWEQRTITCYRHEYRTELREVQRTVYRRVPVTREKEIQETVLVPHWREEERQRTVLVPVTREVQRQR